MCLEKALATDSIDLPAAHTSLLVLFIKKSFAKAQKESRDLDSEDVEELAKQTLLSTEDVEMWVTHLDSVKKRQQAGARKATDSGRIQATTGNEFWCLCGGSETGNMIACDNPGCPIEWFHFECVGLGRGCTCGCTFKVESGFALNVLFNIFKAITLQKCSVAM